jgi:hypothetical protein
MVERFTIEGGASRSLKAIDARSRLADIAVFTGSSAFVDDDAYKIGAS